MGGKLTKTAHGNADSSEWSQTNGHQSATTEKKSKTKKEKASSVKRVDKSTSIDIDIITASSATIKYLVGSAGHPIPDNLSCDAFSGHSAAADHPSKDVLELRDVCIKRGIVSPEYYSMYRSASKDEVRLRSTESIPLEQPPQESTNETSIVPVTDIDQVEAEVNP